MSGSSQPQPNVGRRDDGFLDPYGLVPDASDDEVIELASDPEVLLDLCRRPRGGWAFLAVTEAGLWRAIETNRPGDACRVGLARTRVWETIPGGSDFRCGSTSRMGLWGLVDLSVQVGAPGVDGLEEVIRLAPREVLEVLAEVTLGNDPQPVIEPLPYPVRFSLVYGAQNFRQDLGTRRDEVSGWFAAAFEAEAEAEQQPDRPSHPGHPDPLPVAVAEVQAGQLLALTGSSINPHFKKAVELCGQVLAGGHSDRAVELLEQVVLTEHVIDGWSARAAIHAMAVSDPDRALELTALTGGGSHRAPWRWIPDLLVRRDRIGSLAQRLEDAARIFQQLVPLTKDTEWVLRTLDMAVPTLGPLEWDLETLWYFDRRDWLVRLAAANVESDPSVAAVLLHRVLDEPELDRAWRLRDVVDPLVRLMAVDPALGTSVRDRLLERLELIAEDDDEDVEDDDGDEDSWIAYFRLAEASDPSVATRLAALLERLRPTFGPGSPNPWDHPARSRADAQHRLAEAQRRVADVERRLAEIDPDANPLDVTRDSWGISGDAWYVAPFFPDEAVDLVRAYLSLADRWDPERRYGYGDYEWDDWYEVIGGAARRLSQVIDEHRHTLLQLSIDADRDCPQYEGTTGLGLAAGALETLDPVEARRALGHIFERPQFLGYLTWGAEQTVLDIFDGECLIPIAEDVTRRVEQVAALLQRHHDVAAGRERPAQV